MGKQEQYEKNKAKLLNDKSICKSNRNLYAKYLKEKEYKLKRIRGIPKLSETQYKTLCINIASIKNINLWFKNRDLTKITQADIQGVYDGLEDETLKGIGGKPIKTKSDYYEKYFKSLLFELAGKKEIAKKVMKYYNTSKKEEVRFFDEEIHKKILSVVNTPQQKALCWLAWDIGENIFTLLQLQKKDFIKKKNPDTKEEEYIVNLPLNKIKTGRTTRSEPTNYKETCDFLDIVLSDLKDDDEVFNFQHRQAAKFLSRAVKIVKAKCLPKGQIVTWKDYRSSMACHLLKSGWTTDEIKARLGHKPSSRVLDKYCSYIALGKHTAKKKLFDNILLNVQGELEEAKERERLMSKRQEKLQTQIKEIYIEKDNWFNEFQDKLLNQQHNFIEVAAKKGWLVKNGTTKTKKMKMKMD